MKPDQDNRGNIDALFIDALFEDQQTLIAHLDTDLRFVRVNKAYANADKKDPSYFVGKRHFDLYPNSENEIIFKRALATGTSHHEKAKAFDYEYHPERGTTYWDWNIHPIIGTSKKTLGLILTIIDVSQRINAEQLLEKAQETAHIGTWDWDISSDTLKWTKEIYNIFGLQDSDSEVTYAKFLESVHPDDRKVVEAAVLNAMTGDSPNYQIEHRVVRPSGEIRHVEEQGKIFRNLHDKPSRMIGIVRDITENKLQQLELERYKNKLEKLVEERTQELVNAQNELVQKEKLATLGQLTASIGHELRNPIAAIMPAMYILERSLADSNDTIQRQIGIIERNLGRCDSIIDELLTFSRNPIETQNPGQLDDWLRELIEEYNESQAKIAVSFKPNLGNSQILFDKERLSRAITNALDNAIAALYIDSSRKVLKESAEILIATYEKDDKACIQITDNGAGIAEDLIDKIMEPLYSTRNFGVGLGMAIIEQIIKEHSGELAIESKPGIGTTLSFILPLARTTQKSTSLS